MDTRKWLILIGALGLSLRIALALSIKPVLLYDSLEYHEYARHLAQEHKYYATVFNSPQATVRGIFRSTRAPGYVFFVAAIYKLFGVNDRAVALVQGLLDFMSGLFVFLIARNWLKPKTAVWAFAGYQILAVQVPMLMSEAFFLFLFLFSLWVICGNRRQSPAWMSVCGLAWGMIVLTKPETVIFVPLILAYLLWRNHSRPALARTLLWILLCAAAIIPWLEREREVHGRFVWITTRGGATFFDGSYLPISKRKVFLEAERQRLDEVSLDRLFFKVTLQYLKQHPGHYFKVSFKRLRVLFDLKTYDGMERFLVMPLLEQNRILPKALAFAAYYLCMLSRLVMILGLAGAIANVRRARELFLLYAIPITIVIFHFLLFLGKPRYLAPAYPCLCIFFALLISGLPLRGREQG